MNTIMNRGIDVLRQKGLALHGAPDDYDALMDLVGDARFVLIGEASHGTREFYRERAEITKRLIAEKGFAGVAAEADWPDAYRVNRFVLGRGEDRSAEDALGDFKRFPRWMWRNTDVRDFIDWLRDYNDSIASAAMKVGFYGLDLYSLHASMEAVLGYLDRMDAEAASRARYRYGCFDHFGEDTQRYGYAAGFGLTKTCEDEVVTELVEIRRRARDFLNRDGLIGQDEFFYAEQNARLVKNAEQYYRSMFHGRVSSWNLRDRHMTETLDALTGHLSTRRPSPKLVVWAHNSHLGDARATQMSESGELNVGQLIRQGYGRDARLIGFTTYHGTVAAAAEWDGPVERKRVRPALAGSYEALFHGVGMPRFFISCHDAGVANVLGEQRLERAIGVIYLPETERSSHYFYADVADQFDAVLHLDHTSAVEALDRGAPDEGGEVAETFPTGI